MPEHERVFHIFNNNIIMAVKCARSPVKRKIFIMNDDDDNDDSIY